VVALHRRAQTRARGAGERRPVTREDPEGSARYATDRTDAPFALVALDRVHTPLLLAHGTGGGPVAVARAHEAHPAGAPARQGALWRAHGTCETGTSHMPTQQRTVEFLLEQMAGAGSLAARKMFGEYAVYVDAKVVALICDDQLYVKPTPAGRALLGPGWPEAPPYGGAKPSLVVPGERWDDRAWLARARARHGRRPAGAQAEEAGGAGHANDTGKGDAGAGQAGEGDV
jgi:DNA transformation protein